MKETLRKLEHYEVVSRVLLELSNYLNLEDKDLAEYVTHLGELSATEDILKEKLLNDGLESPAQLTRAIFNITRKIHKNHTSDSECKVKNEKIEGFEKGDESDPNVDLSNAHDNTLEKTLRFPGLCLPNTFDREELKINIPHDVKKLSKTALDLLDEEKTDRERLEDLRQKKRSNILKNNEPVDLNNISGRSESRSRSSSQNDSSNADQSFYTYRNGDLKLYQVYKGEVSRLLDYGAFISFYVEKGGRKEGLVHIQDISKQPFRRGAGAIHELLKRNQKVFVKVIGIAGQKIALSMREVDQLTGKDLRLRSDCKKLKNDFQENVKDSSFGSSSVDARQSFFQDSCESSTHEAKYTSGIPKPLTNITGMASTFSDVCETKKNECLPLRRKKKKTDLEKWELQQMRSSGVITYQEDSDLDEEYGVLPEIDATEKDIEIELSEKEPAFLQGQTTKTGALLSPIRVVANPDGSLTRAAATASALSKERREVREQQEKTLLDWIPKDMHRPWEDPNPEPGERTIAQALRGIGRNAYEVPEWKSKYIGKSVSYGQKSTKSIKEQRESLPIFTLRSHLLNAIRDHQVLIVIGETGSGKTTQITQYLVEAGYTKKGKIGCTQPRRVAAMSVAKRVAEEYGCRLGQDVGYSIRFEDCTSPDTVIKYMTDGMLLRESLIDITLSEYSVIMLDEAHERTVSTDVLFGLLKDTCRRRSNFKLIVTSATLDAEKFSTYFFDAKIFTIPGRTFPVEILYSREPETDYIEASLITVLQIHLCEPPGDILLFLTGQEEIDTACQTLHERMRKLESMEPPPLIILPVYSALPSEMQTMIFDPPPPGCRKCVIATNIAEASLTIDGIYFVVDPGFGKVKMYNPKTGMDSLVVIPISQANARQRAGRAGRTGPGKCYRLYTQEAYRNEMLPTAVPELQRTNLENTVLVLKAMGVNDLLHFDFMDAPPVQTLINAMEHLFHLGALDDEGLMTRLGRKMAEFPMDPSLSKMLLTSVDLECSDEAITIAAMLQVQNVFYRPCDKQALADQKKAKFHQAEGDHLTYLEVYKQWKKNHFSNAWCYENFIQARALRRVQDVRKQLISIMDRYNFLIISCGMKYDRLRQAICAGFIRHVCKRDAQEGYRTLLDNQQVYLHPSSSLYTRNPDWIVYHELVLTTKEYLRDCCTVEPQWLVRVAPHLFKYADETKLSKRKQRERIDPLFNRYEEPNAWRLSRRRL
ncbi:uncharacterized protein LOC128884344 isoform X2 [Hylaeus volcanicus]|uniref:uncharacterized protein LOC128884344 isoform X2 n=1 Tax=Hylaeus volcanicus TaxID=313075 RepID=UPI0023B85CBB|nr:uncharacterized protein LOC128884344 isoform X2 [Hylaeus volcanicus]